MECSRKGPLGLTLLGWPSLLDSRDTHFHLPSSTTSCLHDSPVLMSCMLLRLLPHLELLVTASHLLPQVTGASCPSSSVSGSQASPFHLVRHPRGQRAPKSIRKSSHFISCCVRASAACRDIGGIFWDVDILGRPAPCQRAKAKSP